MFAATDIPALMAQGLALHRQGQTTQALSIYTQVLRINPRHFDALHLSGLVAFQNQNHRDALKLIGKALTVMPRHALAHSNHGNVLKETGKYQEALQSYARALDIDPHFADAHYNRAVALRQLHRLDEALDSYDRAIQSQPGHAMAYNNRGNLLNELGRLDEALASFDRAIAVHPVYVDAHQNRGLALMALQRLEEALMAFDQAIAIDPGHAPAHHNRGNVLMELGRAEEALASYELAISIHPDYAEAHNHLGLALLKLHRMADALQSHDRAIELNPLYADAHTNRGSLLSELRRNHEAAASFERALALQPDDPVAGLNLSMTLLGLGQWERGWSLYESRWKKPEMGWARRDLSQPLWLGDAHLQGKTILLHAEQGLGDSIQFARYARLVQAQGARVILEIPKSLLKLFQTLQGVDELIEQGQALPPCDYHCPLMSLPLAFKTSLDRIPGQEPYLFALPEQVAQWHEKLNANDALRVGLVWNGGFRPGQPELWAVNERRNIPLRTLAAGLNSLKNVTFYSLQKGEPAESEIKGQEQVHWPMGNLVNLAHEIHDFADTAALIAHLDLVISVDTSTAHLAAAMGKPTWILQRFDGCWRWLMDRDDSPWYPTVQQYRQDASRSWEPVLERVAHDLERWPRPPNRIGSSHDVSGQINP